MPGELLENRPSYMQPQLALENPAGIRDITAHSSAGYYDGSIASCKDYPLPSFLAKNLFVIEPEQNLDAGINEQLLKPKENFFKRFSLGNIKQKSSTFFSKTIFFWKDKIWSYFVKDPSNQKIGISSKSMEKPTKKVQDSIAKHSEKASVVAAAPSTAPAPSNIVLDDFDIKRIKEIEEIQASYEAELENSGRDNMKKLMEMVCKLSILVGTLGHRYNKKEIKDYFNHIEANIKKRVKTFEGGRTWTYISVAIQGTAALFSFASLGGGIAEAKGFINLGKTLTGLGSTTSSLSYFGQATTKIGDIKSEEKTALRTQHEHDGEKYRKTRDEMDRQNERVHQYSKDYFDMWKNVLQQETQAKRQAAPAA